MESLKPCVLGGPEVNKQSIRVKVWDFIEKENLANFPRPVHNRIPNFKGADRAGMSVALLPEFSSARTVKVNPDKPQEEVRYQVLAHHKELLVPTPRLKSGIFNRLINSGNDSKQELRILASRQGIDTRSKPVSIETKLAIDLVVIGSVAVDRLGHRIGKGEGFADLEFALAASHHGAVDQNTVVVSTVHDCQVFDSFPEHLFTDHDVPVDIIVTPTEVIRIEKRLSKPVKIIWNLLTEEKLKQVSLLKAIRMSEESSGIDVTLHGKSESKIERSETTIDNKIKKNNSVSTNVVKELQVNQNQGLYFSNIPKDVRVSEFKDALRNTGAKLVFVRWKPFKQAAVVYFEGKSEELINICRGVEINQTPLQVEELKTKKTDHTKRIIEPSRKDTINKDRIEMNSKKAKKKIQNKEEMLSSLGIKSGLFFGQIPRKSKKAELLCALEERDALPIHIDWNGRKGFASAFWNEDAQEVFEKLKGLSVADTIINIEYYNKPVVQQRSETSKDSMEKNEETEIDCLDVQDEKEVIVEAGEKEKHFLVIISGVIIEAQEKEQTSISKTEIDCLEVHNEKEIIVEAGEQEKHFVVENEIDQVENNNGEGGEIAQVPENEDIEISCLDVHNENEVMVEAEENEQASISENEFDQVEYNIGEGSEIMQVPAVNCCDMIRDMQDFKTEAVNYDENIAIEETNRNVVKSSHLYDNVSPNLQNSLSKLSLKSISSQYNIEKETIKESNPSTQNIKPVASQKKTKISIQDHGENIEKKMSDSQLKNDKIRIPGEKHIQLKEKDPKSKKGKGEGMKSENAQDTTTVSKAEKRPESKNSNHDEVKKDKGALKHKVSSDTKTVHKSNITHDDPNISKKSNLVNLEQANNITKRLPKQDAGKSKAETKSEKQPKEEKVITKTDRSEPEKSVNTKTKHDRDQSVSKRRAKSSARPADAEKSHKAQSKPSSPEPKLPSKAAPNNPNPEKNTKSKTDHKTASSAEPKSPSKVETSGSKGEMNSSPEPKLPSKAAPNNPPKPSNENTLKTNSKNANDNPEKNTKSKTDHKTTSSTEPKSPSKVETPGSKGEMNSSPEPKLPSKAALNNPPKPSNENTLKTNSKNANDNPEKNTKSKTDHKAASSTEPKSPSKVETPGSKGEKDNCAIC